MAAGQEIGTFLTELANGIRIARGTVGDPLSLAEVTKSSRVEPITIVGEDLRSLPELTDILQGVLNIFTAHYLQAASVLTAEIHGINIRRILETLNPDRDLQSTLSAYTTNIATLSMENYKYRLPVVIKNNPALEFTPPDGGGNKRVLTEQNDISVGKVIDITVTPKDGGNAKLTFNVSVRLAASFMPESVLTAIIGHDDGAYTLSERWDAFRAGRISFFKDLLFASDLIENQKKLMRSDTTGLYGEIVKRINNSKLYSATTKGLSLNGISSIYVISNKTDSEIKRKFGAGVDNRNIRNIVFKNSMAMMIVLVDKEWDKVTVYTKGIAVGATASFKAFKGGSKNPNAGPDIADVLKAFSSGNASIF